LVKGINNGELEQSNTRFAFFCGNNKKMRDRLLEGLRSRGWKCDLSGGRGPVVRNSKRQLRTLHHLRKNIERLSSDPEPHDRIKRIKELVQELRTNKEKNLDSISPDLRCVIERGLEAVDHLVDELAALDNFGELESDKADAWVQHSQAEVLEVERVYGNIIDDVRVFRHESGASATIQGFTSQDHEYVAVSDLWVTKTGSSTFNQCIYQHVPMLLDGTSRPLDWEGLNFELGETYRFSESVTSFKEFFGQMNAMLRPETNEKYRQAERNYLEKRPRQAQFSRNIVDLTYELLDEAEERKVEKEENAIEAAKVRSEKAAAWKKLSITQKVGKIFSKIFHTVVDILVRIATVVFQVLISPFSWSAKRIANYAYFSGFNCSRSKQRSRRRQLIREKNAEPIEGDWKPLVSPVSNRAIDAVRIPSTSPNPTGNAIIYVLGKHYQDYHPQNYEHLLADGADVILFNPSKKDTKTMAGDLKEVIKELRRRNPDQKLSMHGYCIGAHVATAVAADIAAGAVDGLQAESIPAIIDRGFEDAQEVAGFANRIANLSFARKYINRYYNAKSNDIGEHKAPMLFVTPIEGDDQVNHKMKRNFTLEIMEHHVQGKNQVVQLLGGDHWSAWPVDVHNKVKKFLSKQGIIATTYRKVTEDDFGGKEKLEKKTSVPWVRRNVVPIFV